MSGWHPFIRSDNLPYASIAAKVDTQITTQAAKKLLSSRVSNFMATLLSIKW